MRRFERVTAGLWWCGVATQLIANWASETGRPSLWVKRGIYGQRKKKEI